MLNLNKRMVILMYEKILYAHSGSHGTVYLLIQSDETAPYHADELAVEAKHYLSKNILKDEVHWDIEPEIDFVTNKPLKRPGAYDTQISIFIYYDYFAITVRRKGCENENYRFPLSEII